MNLKAVISTFNEINPDELWLTFGTGSNLGIYLSMKLLLTRIPEFVLCNFPMFHAFTACDTVSVCCGKGKKTAWNTWKVYPEVVKSFHCCKLRPVTWLWKCWNNLWYCFMIVRVISQMLMIAEHIWLHRRPGALKTYHHSRSAKQHIKQARYQYIC